MSAVRIRCDSHRSRNQALMLALLFLPFSGACTSAADRALTFTVPGAVSPVQKTGKNDCWATSGTAMASWWENAVLTTDAVLERAGSQYVALMKADNALSSDQGTAFFGALGMVTADSLALRIEDLSAALKQYGPLLLVSASPGGDDLVPRAELLTGVRAGGFLRSPKMTVINPCADEPTGIKTEENVGAFAKRHEAQTALRVIHYPNAITATTLCKPRIAADVVCVDKDHARAVVYFNSLSVPELTTGDTLIFEGVSGTSSACAELGAEWSATTTPQLISLRQQDRRGSEFSYYCGPKLFGTGWSHVMTPHDCDAFLIGRGPFLTPSPRERGATSSSFTLALSGRIIDTAEVMKGRALRTSTRMTVPTTAELRATFPSGVDAREKEVGPLWMSLVADYRLLDKRASISSVVWASDAVVTTWRNDQKISPTLIAKIDSFRNAVQATSAHLSLWKACLCMYVSSDNLEKISSTETKFLEKEQGYVATLDAVARDYLGKADELPPPPPGLNLAWSQAIGGGFDDSFQFAWQWSPPQLKKKSLRHQWYINVYAPSLGGVVQSVETCARSAIAAGALAGILTAFTPGAAGALDVAVSTFVTVLEACAGVSLVARIDDVAHWTEWGPAF